MKTRDRIFNVIKEYREEYGISPSFRDIQHRTGIVSTSVVSFHIDRLINEGRINKIPNTARSLTIVEDK